MNDSTDYMDFLRPLLPKLGEIEGITEEEIADLECRYKVVLPEAYKQYMRIFGRKNGKMLQGENMCIDMLENILESY